jgi:hypothetical protein
MPLPLAALVALSLGALFAHAARAELAQSDAPLMSSRPAAIAAAFAAFVYLPAVAYFAAFHGDWAYMYFVPWRRIPSAIDLAVVLACAALVPAGFLAAAPLARARRREAVLALIAAPAGAAALLAVVLEHRLGTSATFAQFVSDFDTRPIAQTALGRAMLVAIAVCAVAVVHGVRLLHAGAPVSQQPSK